MSVVVLYEDKRSKDARQSQYLPHQFVLHCVADQVGCSPWDLLDRVRGIPLNGVGKLKATMMNPVRFQPSGESLVVVADADVVHEHFGLPVQAPVPMCASILATLPNRTGMDLFLLVDNLETVVAASARALGRKLPEKSHNARDGVLGGMLDPGRVAARAQVVQRVPMLQELVAHLSGLVRI